LESKTKIREIENLGNRKFGNINLEILLKIGLSDQLEIHRHFQIFKLFYGLKPDLLEIMLITFLFEKHGCPEITRTGYQKTCAKKSTTAFTLLGNLKILYRIVVEEISDNHFSLGSAVSVCFVREADVYTRIKKWGQPGHIPCPDGCNHSIHIIKAPVRNEDERHQSQNPSCKPFHKNCFHPERAKNMPN
jgi:hypothetical protein